MVYSGLIFASLGFWWHINNCTRYIRSLGSENDEKVTRQQIKFEGSTAYPCFCLPFKVCRRWPIESIVKMIITFINITIRVYLGYSSVPKPYIGIVEAYHIPLFFGFFLASWTEILVHYNVSLPNRITQVMGALAFVMEGFIIMLHTPTDDLVLTHIHRLLALTITCSMIVAIGECFLPNKFEFIVARSFFALTQGTWYIQAAFVFAPLTANPYFTWDRHSQDSVLYTTMCYTYHLAGNAVMLIILYLVIQRFVSRSIKLNPNQVDDDRMDGYKLITNVDDDNNGL